MIKLICVAFVAAIIAFSCGDDKNHDTASINTDPTLDTLKMPDDSVYHVLKGVTLDKIKEEMEAEGYTMKAEKGFFSMIYAFDNPNRSFFTCTAKDPNHIFLIDGHCINPSSATYRDMYQLAHRICGGHKCIVEKKQGKNNEFLDIWIEN